MPAYPTIASLARKAATLAKNSAENNKLLWAGGTILGGAAVSSALTGGYRKVFGERAFGQPGLNISDPRSERSPIPLTGSVLEKSGMDAFIRPSSLVGDIGRGFSSLGRPIVPGSNTSAASMLVPAMLAGAGATGLASGLIAGALTRSISGAMMGIVAGGAVGGQIGYKLARGTAEVMSNVAKAYYGLNTPKPDYRSFGGGQGFRTWYKRPGGRMSPGHLGADGSLPLAMHKIRNRSVTL